MSHRRQTPFGSIRRDYLPSAIKLPRVGMRLSLLFFLLVATLSATTLRASVKDELEITIAIPMNGLDDRVAGSMSHPDSRFHVVLTNVSDHPQWICNDGNSWGYDALSFEISDADGKKWPAGRKPRGRR